MNEEISATHQGTCLYLSARTSRTLRRIELKMAGIWRLDWFAVARLHRNGYEFTKPLPVGREVPCGPCSHQCNCHFSCSCLLWTAISLKIHAPTCRCFVLHYPEISSMQFSKTLLDAQNPAAKLKEAQLQQLRPVVRAQIGLLCLHR